MHNNCLNCHVVANETVVCILLSTSVRGNSYAIASGDIVYISTANSQGPVSDTNGG